MGAVGQGRPSTPPGIILWHEFLVPHRVSVAEFAEMAEMDPGIVQSVIDGRCAVDEPIARRFAAMTGTTPQFWINLQEASQ